VSASVIAESKRIIAKAQLEFLLALPQLAFEQQVCWYETSCGSELPSERIT
jgi:hypothetical protein